MIEEYKDLADTLLERLEVFKRLADEGPGTTVEVPLDAELLETLRSLGYVE